MQTIATFICQQYPHNYLLLLANTVLPITLIFIQQSPVFITQHYSSNRPILANAVLTITHLSANTFLAITPFYPTLS
jgi:hypothetical protein